MVKTFNDTREKILNKMNMPVDMVYDLPRVTMLGHSDVYIENHKGLKNFSKTVVELNIKTGYLVVEGDNFTIKEFTKDEIMIGGKIFSVRMVEQVNINMFKDDEEDDGNYRY